MIINYSKSVPKNIKGMIKTFIKQNNIKVLNNLEIYFCCFNISVSSKIINSGNYFCRYENKIKYSYNQFITIDII